MRVILGVKHAKIDYYSFQVLQQSLTPITPSLTTKATSVRSFLSKKTAAEKATHRCFFTEQGGDGPIDQRCIELHVFAAGK